jgi:hypothetical protein
MRSAGLFVVFLFACGGSNRPNNNNIDAPMGECTEGANRCNGTDWQSCTGGMWTTALSCPVACADGIGCVQCVPNTMTCNMTGDVATCDANGNPGATTTPCSGTTICENGACVDACAEAASSRSYVGCEYWAVDLDNALQVDGLQADDTFFTACDFDPYGQGTAVTMMVCYTANDPNTGAHAVSGTCDPGYGAANNSCPSTGGYSCSSQAVCTHDAQHSPFGIVVSNPNAKDVMVTVTPANGSPFTTTVQAGAVQALMPQSHSIPDQSVDNTGDEKLAYQVTSTLPIVAYQFNPLDNVNVFSNDASLLLPRTAWDIDYIGMSWQTANNRSGATPNFNNSYGYLTIVSYKDGTVVSVTPTAAVQASTTQMTIAAGTATNFTIDAFHVLNLEAVADGDLTGTIIHSMDGTTPIGVFGGHEAANFGETTPPDSTHTNGPCCADHLEEMLFPSSTWGMNFAIARSKQRTNEPDYIRILAQKAGTAVTFNPAPTTVVSGNCASLGVGQFCDVKIQGDTSITASQPVLVGHFLESSIWQDTNPFSTNPVVGSGDPSMAIAVPVEQYRTDYTILIPNAYMNNYLSISAPPTGAVFVDGTMQTMTGFASNTYRSVIATVTAGQHHIQCAGTCGLMVYGYDNAVSYMFAGGLDLKQIVVQ